MRTPLPATAALVCLLVALARLSFAIEIEDATTPPGVVMEVEPDTVIIGEDGAIPTDGDVAYEMDWCDSDDFHHRPDSHAPAGLGGDHTHKQGEWMVEYKYAYMNMQGMRTGTTSVTPVQAAAGAGTAASPTGMNMQMNMGHVMYGLTDCVTLYAMFMWTDLSMEHRFDPAGANVFFTTNNSDFDDLPIGALLKLYETCNSEWIGNLGLVLPTGDIGRQVRPGPPPPPGTFPYPMRTGSGHVSFRPGLTYKKWNDCGSLGVQAMGYIPLHDNYRDYREGAEARVSFWIARLITPCTSASFRVEGFWCDDYSGADPGLNPATVTTANPSAQGRSDVNLYGGLNTIRCGHRFAVEIGAPVYQDVQGYQLEQDLFLFASWSKAF